MVAKGRLCKKRHVLHGHKVNANTQVVTIEEVLQAGAEPWFPDPFGEGLSKGCIVQWPEDMLCGFNDLSPMHTRTRTVTSNK